MRRKLLGGGLRALVQEARATVAHANSGTLTEADRLIAEGRAVIGVAMDVLEGAAELLDDISEHGVLVVPEFDDDSRIGKFAESIIDGVRLIRGGGDSDG